jgi:hypothetical protein
VPAVTGPTASNTPVDTSTDPDADTVNDPSPKRALNTIGPVKNTVDPS